MLISRTDRGAVATWWFTVDRLLLTAVLLLMAAGVIIDLAASPPVAVRLGYDAFHFFKRQLAYLVPAAAILLATSLLDEKQARRVAFFVLILGMALMGAALAIGPEIKGAHRWINIGPLNLQPSEFVKPAFVVVTSWLLAERTRQPDLPGHFIAVLLFAIVVAMLIVQPDFGQTALLSLVFAVMLLVYGISWFMILGLAGLGLAGVGIAYKMLPHVASRIDRFFSPDSGDTFQVDTAVQAFQNGGLFGTGPGGGTAKQFLPDAHSDFIFSVLGEEYGFFASIILLGLFAFIVVRVLQRAQREDNPFSALSLTGLVSIFGLQAVINMAVNVSLIPAKGMTLPFISYGGSSLLAMAFAMGLILVFGKRRARVELHQPFAAAPAG